MKLLQASYPPCLKIILFLVKTLAALSTSAYRASSGVIIFILQVYIFILLYVNKRLSLSAIIFYSFLFFLYNVTTIPIIAILIITMISPTLETPPVLGNFSIFTIICILEYHFVSI